MDGLVDFLRGHRDLIWKVAIGAAVLSILFPIVQGYYLWIGGKEVLGKHTDLSFWVLGTYFFDAFIAAIVVGVLVRNWGVLHVGIFGLVAQLLLVTGALITDNENVTGRSSGGFGGEIGSFQGDLQLYLTSTLHWIWIIGLIAFGVALGRKVGDLFSELDEAAPVESAEGSSFR